MRRSIIGLFTGLVLVLLIDNVTSPPPPKKPPSTPAPKNEEPVEFTDDQAINMMSKNTKKSKGNQPGRAPPPPPPGKKSPIVQAKAQKGSATKIGSTNAKANTGGNGASASGGERPVVAAKRARKWWNREEPGFQAETGNVEGNNENAEGEEGSKAE